MSRSLIFLLALICKVFGSRLAEPIHFNPVAEAPKDPVLIYAAEGDPEVKQQPSRRSIPPYELSALGFGSSFTGNPLSAFGLGTSAYGFNSAFGTNPGFTGLNGYGMSGMGNFGMSGLSGLGLGTSRFGLMGSGLDTVNPLYRSSAALNPNLYAGNSFMSTGTYPASNTAQWNNPSVLNSMNWAQMYNNPSLLNSNTGNLDLTTLQLLLNGNSNHFTRNALGNQNWFGNGLSSNDLNLMLSNRNVLNNGLATQQFNPLTLSQTGLGATGLKRSPPTVQDPQSPYYTHLSKADDKEETTTRNQKRNLN